MKLIWGILLLAGIVLSEKVSYNGDQMWRVYTQSQLESYSIQDILANYKFDVWTVTKEHLDFRVPREVSPKISKLWKEKGVDFKVIISDVGALINKTEILKDDTKIERAEFAFDQYHPLDEIFAFLDEISSTSELVSQEEIGRTNEGRELRVIKVSTPNSTFTKPAVWIDCGIHAREWISPATCLWGLNYLVSQYGVDDNVTRFLDDNDLFLLPVLNADGYDYTWTDDRLWRKNRMQYSSEDCVGVDLNRNYDDGHYGGVGASNSTCAVTYHGPTPFSELESRAVRDKVLAIQETQEVKSFFSMHSYGQLWLFAFGWTNDLPAESDELYRVSQAGVDAIASYSGSVYTNGPHFSAIYPASGTSVDWGYSAGIVHTYIVELRDTGDFAFLLPEDQILPTATEAWTGLITAINAI